MLQPKPKPITAIYDLLKASGYPGIPERKLAMEFLRDAAHVTLCDGDKLVAWVGVHRGGGDAALDVAVLPEYRGKWLTKRLIKGVLASVFAKGVKRVKVKTSQPSVIKLANRMGFKMDVSKYLPTSGVELWLTKDDFEGKYL